MKPYNLYQLLYLESYTPGTTNPDGTEVKGTYSYKVTSAWSEFFNTDDAKKYFSVKDGYATWILGGYTGKDVVEFTQKAITYANNNNIKPVKTVTLAATDTEKIGAQKACEFSDLKLGYYLIDTSLGSLCTLNTAAKEITVNDKNDIPTTDKKVNEGSEWLDNNDIEIGKEFSYRSIIKFKSGVKNIIYHDKMGNGLTFKGVTSIVIDEESADPTRVKSETLNPNWYEVVTTDLDDGCTFHIVFKDDFYNYALSLAGDHTLTVKYKGELNESAYVGSFTINDEDILTSDKKNNVNTHKLTYGDKNNSTVEYKTITKTFEVPVFKNTLDGSNQKIGLDGTKFVLSTQPLPANMTVDEYVVDEGFTKYKFIKEPEKKTIGSVEYVVYRIPTTAELNNTAVEKVDEIVTDSTGRFIISGLDAGTYYLYETEAHKGYNKLTGPVTIVVNKDGTIKKNETVASAGYIDIENSTGTLLPSTGGIGTTIFYVAGSILLIGAAILLIVKKRMSNEK